MDVQFIKTENGEELVVMTRHDYEALLEAAEDSDDLVAAYQGLKSLHYDGEIDINVSKAIRSGLHPVAAWRQHRGLTQTALAKAVGISQAAIARIEGREPGSGSMATLTSLSQTLNAPLWSLYGHHDNHDPSAS
jgi:DNA-binding XRE family transcriptional regulator